MLPLVLLNNSVNPSNTMSLFKFGYHANKASLSRATTTNESGKIAFVSEKPKLISLLNSVFSRRMVWLLLFDNSINSNSESLP